MRSPLLIAAIMAISSPALAEKLDLTSMKCKQYVEIGGGNSSIITAWLTGYHADESDSIIIDLERLKETGDRLSAFCTANPNFSVASAAEGLFGK